MIEIDQERKAFEEMLPLYVNGTLDAADIQFMENYLVRFPELEMQVKFSESLRLAIKDEANVYSSDATWEKLHKNFKAFHAKPSLIEQIKIAFANWGLSPAFAVVLGLLVAQSAFIYQAGLFDSSSIYRGDSLKADTSPHLKITINPKTEYAQLAELLRKNGCHVISGPSETGELWINLEDPKKLLQIKADLINSGLIDEAISINQSSN